MSNTIFIIAHAPLAQALRECAMHVYAECAPTVLALDVQASAEPEDTLSQAHALLAHVPHDEGLLVLTDIFGATRHKKNCMCSHLANSRMTAD